eukprot:1867778-Pleurochrysis_carterae.AAC.1
MKYIYCTNNTSSPLLDSDYRNTAVDDVTMKLHRTTTDLRRLPVASVFASHRAHARAAPVAHSTGRQIAVWALRDKAKVNT